MQNTNVPRIGNDDKGFYIFVQRLLCFLCFVFHRPLHSTKTNNNHHHDYYNTMLVQSVSKDEPEKFCIFEMLISVLWNENTANI